MKVCFVIFDFKKSNIRLQPWRYIYEVSKRMKSNGLDVEIITNGYPALPNNEIIEGMRVFRLKRLNSYPFVKNNELIRLITKTSPDLIIWIIGPTVFYFLPTMKKLNKPIIGLWIGSTYGLKHFINLGGNEILRNFHSVYGHVVNTLIPSFLIRKSLNNQVIKKIIVINENNKRLIFGYDTIPEKVSVIRPGINEYDLKPSNQSRCEELKNKMKLRDNDFFILYLGSPSSLRGVDTLVNAISLIEKNITSIKLILLSRRRPNDFLKEENYIKELCFKNRINNRTHIISAILTPDEIQNYIDISDVVVLPFKLVQSDTPIAILEVMARGKPLISTNLDGIPELLDKGRGILIEPNNPKEIAKALYTLYSKHNVRKNIEEKAKEYMLGYPTWDDTTHCIITTINEILR